MDVSIRMIDVASTVFWVLLIAFLGSAVYSVKDLHLGLGEPQLSLTTDGYVVVSIPIDIENRGYYSLSDFNLTTKVADLNGSKITEGSTLIPLVERGNGIFTFHNLTFSINMLLEKGSHYLFNDSILAVTTILSVKLAEAIPVQASSTFSVPWGAPFYNFQLGQPTYEPVNLTHLKVEVPISFENHSPIGINGKVNIHMYNCEGALIGEGESIMVAPQGNPYLGFVALYVETSKITRGGFFEVHFSTSFLSYGPLVIPYG